MLKDFKIKHTDFFLFSESLFPYDTGISLLMFKIFSF